MCLSIKKKTRRKLLLAFARNFFRPDQFRRSVIFCDFVAAKRQNASRRSYKYMEHHYRHLICCWAWFISGFTLAVPGTPSASRLVCPSFSPQQQKQQENFALLCFALRKLVLGGMCIDWKPVGYFQFFWDLWAAQAWQFFARKIINLLMFFSFEVKSEFLDPKACENWF